MTSAPITFAPAAACARCGQLLSPESRACPACGQLVHVRELEQLSAEAMRLEPINPLAAADVWRKCLELLPPEAPQYELVRQRIDMLSRSPQATPWAGHGGTGLDYAPAVPPSDSLLTAVLKTGGSMILSMAVYAYLFPNPWVGVGFVVLMLIHEFGHVIAMKYYGITGSPPIFIPFMGALINLRSSPKNAKEEAIIGIGGPALGTAGALACYALARSLHNPILLEVSFYGFFLNLFNMLPVPPLDGGRITAAVSPWIWMLGLVGLFGLMLQDFIASGFRALNVNPVMLLILFFAAPRIWRTLQAGGRDGPYYQISRKSSWIIAASYVGLGALLIVMYLNTRRGGFL